MIVTIFDHLLDTKNPRYANANVILQRIKEGGKLSPLIKQIRSSKTVEERDELKKKLPIVCFSGKFSERKASGLLEYSGLICLDFDKLECPEDFKSELVDSPYIYACWLSPTGTGVKALVKVSSANHLGHSLALVKEFPELDVNAVKDVPRCCFMSVDPDIYINENSQVFTKFIENATTDQQKYDNLKKWLESKGESFVSGNRNNFIAKLAGAMNRFGISEEFTMEVIERDFCKDSSFSLREAQAVIRSMYRYKEQFGTASFDDAMSEKEVTEILSSEVATNDIITITDLKEDLLNTYHNGLKGGETTYYAELDNHFKWMRKEMTLISGIANMGKSSILSQLLINKMVFEDKKYIFFSPEQAPPIYFYQEFIRTLVGKPIEKNNPNRMTLAEYTRALEFLETHIFYVYPEKESPTPDYIHARMAEAIIKYGADGTVIDPFSSMDNDYSGANGRDDKFLEKFLNKSQRFAIQNDLYYILVTHPKNMTKRADGTFECPDLFDIANGSTWSKRMDNILMYHRPTFPVDRASTVCELKSIKIKKQSLNGKPGTVVMDYDWKRGRFYINGYCPLDNFKL